jgi:3,4-dihydroxy 2-butanone 4-phosphate synthase/GTP cyclohydrolase II
MERIAEEGRGVLVVIRQEEDNKSLVERIHRYQMEDHGVELADCEKRTVDERTTGAGAQILADLGVHKMCVLGERRKYRGISGYDLEIVEYVSCNPNNLQLAVKD